LDSDGIKVFERRRCRRCCQRNDTAYCGTKQH
jgi:hypothetical protein